MAVISGGLQNYNQKFIDTIEHFDTFLSSRARQHPSIWYDRIPKGSLSNFDGLTRKSNIFHGTKGEQAGLLNWKATQTSRKSEGNGDQGYDGCNRYDPDTFTYAVESVQYSPMFCSWQSEPICVNDIRFLAEGRQQCELITSVMAYVTTSVWENFNRENYVKFAVNAGHAFILTAGGLDYADSPTVRFTYDASKSDADGNTYIEFANTLVLSTLNWSFFDWWQDLLGDQCPEAAIASKDGMPIFGLMIHKRDFNQMVLNDADLRQDLRFANSAVLIADYRSFSEFKGWALIHDSRQMRFKYVSNDGTNVRCVRVTPLKDGQAVTIGNIPVANPAYTKAEVAIGVIFMNDVLQNLIPAPIGDLGGGMKFGVVPGYEGTFAWINEYDKQENPLREVGYFFARFEAAPKPLMYAREAIVFAYARQPQTWTSVQAVTLRTASSATATVTKGAVTADVERTAPGPYTVKLTLDKVLTATLGAAVTLTDANSATLSAVVGDASDAPTYVFVAATAPTAHTAWTIAATVAVV